MHRVKQKSTAPAESKKSKSLFSSLKRILFSCTGKKAVRVLPQQISVRPPTAWDDGSRQCDRLSAHASAARLFCSSSRPPTAANENGSGLSPHSAIEVSNTVLVGSSTTIPTESTSDMNATSGLTISVRSEFAGHCPHSTDMIKSDLTGLNPSPVTSATGNTGLTPNRPSTSTASDNGHSTMPCPERTFFRTTLTQIRKQQRQKRREERMRREEELFGKRERAAPPCQLSLEEELKPKKKLSEQIREEEEAIKGMEKMLVDLDADETDVLKKMQQLNNWRVEIETIKDSTQYAIKAGKLNDVILILEDQLHLMKNAGERIESRLGNRKENLIKLKADYELMMASGLSEEDIETNELLKQFLPTLGLPPDTVVGVELDEVDDDCSMASSPCGDVPPRCRNPVATQLLRETRRLPKPFLPDVLHEYIDTLERDSKLVKKSKEGTKKENDGLKKFMQSQIKNESWK